MLAALYSLEIDSIPKQKNEYVLETGLKLKIEKNYMSEEKKNNILFETLLYYYLRVVIS